MHAVWTSVIFMQGGLQGTAWLVTIGCTTLYSELKGLIIEGILPLLNANVPFA